MNFTHTARPVLVEAHAIEDIEQPTSETGFTAVLANGKRVALTPPMMARYTPVIGDYIVTQEDGYVYVNPKDVFERKYQEVPF
jgi:hypothetical protein